MKGDAVTLLLDCKHQLTKPIVRSGPVSNSGVVLLAQEIDDDTFFEVSIAVGATCEF